MSQPKIYKNSAERQAAYRKRKGIRSATQRELAGLARNLHYIIQTAIVYNELPLSPDLAGTYDEESHKILRPHLRSVSESEWKARETEMGSGGKEGGVNELIQQVI